VTRHDVAMARLHDVTFDSRHPASIARFWAAALDGYQVAPSDEAELARLRAKGVFDPEDDPTVVVAAPGTQPRIFFQLVPDSTRSGFQRTSPAQLWGSGSLRLWGQLDGGGSDAP
jgi:hypothetical protein